MRTIKDLARKLDRNKIWKMADLSCFGVFRWIGLSDFKTKGAATTPRPLVSKPSKMTTRLTLSRTQVTRGEMRKGWSQTELAMHAVLQSKGASGRALVSNYERGRIFPNPFHLKAISAALGVQPEAAARFWDSDSANWDEGLGGRHDAVARQSTGWVESRNQDLRAIARERGELILDGLRSCDFKKQRARRQHRALVCNRLRSRFRLLVAQEFFSHPLVVPGGAVDRGPGVPMFSKIPRVWLNGIAFQRFFERNENFLTRRFTRLTNGFSKKVENHAHSVALFAMYYNFVRVHKTLRVTPAMAANVTKRLWEMSDIVDVLEAYEAKAANWGALNTQGGPTCSVFRPAFKTHPATAITSCFSIRVTT
jgi:transcriptional regulator with XRE-family HTH domain